MFDSTTSRALKESGWNISEDALNEYMENCDETVELKNQQDWKNFLLNIDLQKIAEKPVPGQNAELFKHSEQIVLQIVRVRNVAVEKAFENDDKNKRLLKLSLTDGGSSYQAIEMNVINGLSPDTPPGTKISLSKSDLDHNFFLLTNKNCRVLGGKVPEMFEKWNANKKGNPRQSGAVGAPPWVPFGKQVDTSGLTHGFASMSVNQADAAPVVSEQFEQSRNAVIAVAQATGATNKFQQAPTPNIVSQALNNARPPQTYNNRDQRFERAQPSYEQRGASGYNRDEPPFERTQPSHEQRGGRGNQRGGRGKYKARDDPFEQEERGPRRGRGRGRRGRGRGGDEGENYGRPQNPSMADFLFK